MHIFGFLSVCMCEHACVWVSMCVCVDEADLTSRPSYLSLPRARIISDCHHIGPLPSVSWSVCIYFFPNGFHDPIPPCIRFLAEYLPWDIQQAPHTSLHPQTTFSRFFSWWMAPVCSLLPETITGVNLFSVSLCVSGSCDILNSSQCQLLSLSH